MTEWNIIAKIANVDDWLALGGSSSAPSLASYILSHVCGVLCKRMSFMHLEVGSRNATYVFLEAAAPLAIP